MRFTKYATFISILFFSLDIGGASAQVDSLIFAGIDHSIRQDYQRAERLFQQVIEQYPEEPQGYFFLAATLQSKMMDFETDRWADRFLALISKSESLAKRSIEKDATDAWAYFYLGSSKSYRAFYYGKKKKYMPAIRYALEGMSALHKVIELDSTNYDTYFGVGSYKYWRSRLTKFLNWLPLISDERDAGIEMVKLSAEKGKYTRYAAINELTWILIDAGETSAALEWARRGLQKYPDSRFFLWGTAKSYYSLQQYENALDIYRKLLISVQSEQMNNHYNEIICCYKMAECHFRLDDVDSAIACCDHIDSLKISSEIRKRLDNIFDRVKDLKNRISEKLTTR